MDDLINDLLAYTREEVLEEESSLVDLEEICESILHDYEKNHSNVRIQKNLECRNILVKTPKFKSHFTKPDR